MKTWHFEPLEKLTTLSTTLARGWGEARAYQLGPGESISSERHAAAHLLCPLWGDATLETDRPMALQPGQVCQVEAGESYSLATEGGCALLLVAFEVEENR